MYFTPTIFIAQLLAAMQVLMTLDMPLSTTMALPVTSKPIESTVENLAWQAWIELPPEQKQQVKSRKVTPKSIFTLPLRVECPDGQKQVDRKCIPIAIGSNDVLIDLNALGLLVGNTQTDDLYDYDDVGEEMGSPLPFGSDMFAQSETEKSLEGMTVELKPPSKDEPLKFNIFENKFNIFHEEPLEDYSLSYEGLQSSEKEQNTTAYSPQVTNNETLTFTLANATVINDLFSDASNISENSFGIYVQQRDKNATPSSDSVADESKTLSTLATSGEFKIEAISVPAAGYLPHNDSSIQLVTSIIDTEHGTTTTSEDNSADKPQENDLQTLLQTESFLPMLQLATTTTLQDSEADKSAALTTVPAPEPNESSSYTLSLSVDDEEITTLPNVMEPEIVAKDKQEFTRSVTMNPLQPYDNGFDNNMEEVKDTTLETAMGEETSVETTTPIQLDDTTIIETSSSLSTTPKTTQKDLKEVLLQQEQAEKDFEELQRMRKGQKDQHVILKKSKVEPVEVLSTTTPFVAEATITTTSSAVAVRATATETSTTNSPTETVDELVVSSTAETVTPLLTVHNENDNNNDRFYYQHIRKQANEQTQSPGSELAEPAPTKSTEIETVPLTSEIDLAEELRLINELVKGIQPATTLTTIKTMQTTSTTTTEKPTISTTINDEILSNSSPSPLSESLLVSTKPTLSTFQIWSKIMPLLKTTTTTPQLQTATAAESSSSILTTQKNSNIIASSKSSASSLSTRSNRNSKIIRINNFKNISTVTSSSTATDAATTTIMATEDSTPFAQSTTSESSVTNLESSSEDNTYEPYWWLPIAWRLDKPASTETASQEQEVTTEEQQPLLLRFWSAYHAPKSS